MLTLAEERAFGTILPNRQKRGLVNGLGSAIKFITGNLDANDEEKYNRILQHLQTNQEALFQQIDHHYSINNKLTQELNSTIDTINSNHKILVSEIEHLKEASSFEKHLNQVERALEHNQLLLQLILDLTQDIENSVTFCKLRKLHPSIIKPQTLFNVLQNLTTYYGNKLPNFQGESLWDFQTHTKVNCFIGTDEIVYFLDIPILNEENLELFLLQSVPTLHEKTYVTIIPLARFALKSTSSSDIKFLNKECEVGLNNYFCSNSLQLAGEHNCEKDILNNGLNGRCDLIRLDIKANHVEYLEEARRYIFLFPFEDQIKISRPGNIEYKKLSGIFLVSPGSSSIEYQNQTLIAPPIKTSNSPSLIKRVKVSWDYNRSPTSEVKLQSLQYLTAPSQPIPSFRNSLIQHFTPSFWTIVLYITLTSCFAFTTYRYYSHRRKIRIDHSDQNV